MSHKFIYYTIIILSLTTIANSKHLEITTINKIIKSSDKYLSYLTNIKEDPLLNLKKDFIKLLSKEPESKNLEDILYELFNYDLDSLDEKNYENFEDLKQRLKKDLNNEIENQRFELLRLNYSECLENLKNIYIDYLLSFLNYNLKNGLSKIDLDFNPVSDLQNYFLALVEDKEFMKLENENLRNGKLKMNARKKVLKVFLGKESEFTNDLKRVAQEINNERRLRQYYARVKKESFYDINLKIESLFYRITRDIDFNLRDFKLYFQRIKSLSNFYYNSIKDFEEEKKEKLIFNLSFEKIYVNENNNDDNNLNEKYGNLISIIIQQAHLFIPEKSQHLMNEILDTEVPLFKNEIMSKFLLSIYDKRGKGIWNQWRNYEENKKNNYSLMMAEILIFSTNNQTNLVNIEEFVNNFYDLAIIPGELLQKNFFFKLFTLDQCPIKSDFDFNYKLYKAILDMRVQTFTDFEKSNWSYIFDQYLDDRFHYESDGEEKDKEFLRYYANMKILNLFEMEEKDNENNNIISTILELNETTIKALQINKEVQCLQMKNTIIDLVNNFKNQGSFLNYANSVPLLNNLKINIEEFKKMVQKNFDYDINFDFEGNKINTDMPEGLENVIEVIAGGNLTRKESDILKREDILEFFRSKHNRDGNLSYHNNNGSNTKFIYIQMVPKNSDCHKAIKEKLNGLLMKII